MIHKLIPSMSSSPEPCDDSSEIFLDKEYIGVPPPPNAQLPTASELIDLCEKKQQRKTLTLPIGLETPIFWVKYGYSVYWNEVMAQVMAHDELRRLGSSVRAPAVYHAFKYNLQTFLVMEYIPGKTSGQRLQEAESPAEKEHVIGLVASCLSELHRIPIPPGSRPAGVDGGHIRHTLFSDEEAPRHYENVAQLEIHLNEVSPAHQNRVIAAFNRFDKHEEEKKEAN